eukprot:8968402-Alexandrium_andersonii.AAC.1
MGESALTGRLGAPLRGAPSCHVKASSLMVRCLFGDGSDGAPVSLYGGVRPRSLGDSAIVAGPARRLRASCADFTNMPV